MNNLILRLLLLIVFGELITLFVINRPIVHEKVLAEKIVVTPTPTPTPTLVPTKKPTPRPSITPSPAPHGMVNELISKYANLYGLDANVMRHMVLCESGFKSNAKNGQYIGLFQFDVNTWQKIRRELNLNTDQLLRYSAEESIKTAFYAISKGKTKLWPNCNP